MSRFAMHSGRLIDINNMSEKDIHLSDISHHLTKLCRYGGSMPLYKHYSVASHSLALCYYALDHGFSEDVARLALMHDASEAYLGDIVAGLKQHLPDYQAIESKVMGVIFTKYNIVDSCESLAFVKEWDTRIVIDEAAVFMPNTFGIYRAELKEYAPLGVGIAPDGNFELIQKAFLYTAASLGIAD